MMFALFTDIPMADVRKMIAEDIVNAKRVLSYEITKFVRGEEDAKLAEEASKALFAGNGNLDNVPTYNVTKEQLPMSLVDMLANTKLVTSKSEGRRMCEQGGVLVNGEVNKDFSYQITEKDFKDGICLLKKGKKNFMKVVIE